MFMMRRNDKIPNPRSFPWSCPNCGKLEVFAITTNYLADVKHDGKLHQIGISELRAAKCRNCGELVFSADTSEQISAALRSHLGLLSPQAIKSARDSRGMTQKELSKETGIAEETISRWEGRLIIQSRAMDQFVRLYFDLID